METKRVNWKHVQVIANANPSSVIRVLLESPATNVQFVRFELDAVPRGSTAQLNVEVLGCHEVATTTTTGRPEVVGTTIVPTKEKTTVSGAKTTTVATFVKTQMPGWFCENIIIFVVVYK